MTTVEPQMLKGVLALLLLRLVQQREDYGYSLVQRIARHRTRRRGRGQRVPGAWRDWSPRGCSPLAWSREGRGPGRRYYSPTAVRLSSSCRGCSAPGPPSTAPSATASTHAGADPAHNHP